MSTHLGVSQTFLLVRKLPRTVGAMPTPDLGPTGERTAKNFSDLREQSGASLRTMSAKLDVLGRPIPPASLMKIEKGTRRVDVDDLVALALALDVAPNRLLLAAETGGSEIALTPAYAATWGLAWLWACGQTRLGPHDQGRANTAAETFRFIAQSRPHDLPDGDLVDTVERHRDVLAPIARSVQAARAEGVSLNTVIDYLRFTDALDEE